MRKRLERAAVPGRTRGCVPRPGFRFRTLRRSARLHGRLTPERREVLDDNCCDVNHA
jgi:hypothetical protein